MPPPQMAEAYMFTVILDPEAIDGEARYILVGGHHRFRFLLLFAPAGARVDAVCFPEEHIINVKVTQIRIA